MLRSKAFRCRRDQVNVVSRRFQDQQCRWENVMTVVAKESRKIDSTNQIPNAVRMSKCEFSANDGACISPFAVRIEICTYMLPTGSRPHRVTMKVVLHKALLRAV